MKLFLLPIIFAAGASAAGAPPPAAPQALMGCWMSIHSENHWDDGRVTPFSAACSRFFTPTRLHVDCKGPNGGPLSTVVFGYTPISASSFTVQLLKSGKQSYVNEYLRPHEYAIGPGQLTLVSYPRLPKDSAGRSMVKTVSRFAARPGQSSSPGECVPPQVPVDRVTR